LRSARARKARIVVGQKPVEGRDGAIQQKYLEGYSGHPVEVQPNYR